MTNLLFQTALSDTCLSRALIVVATNVGAKAEHRVMK